MRRLSIAEAEFRVSTASADTADVFAAYLAAAQIDTLRATQYQSCFTGAGSRLKIRAAFRPRIFRLDCSDRKCRARISLGRSKSKCGQSVAKRSCVSALIMSNVHSSALRLVASMGCVVY